MDRTGLDPGSDCAARASYNLALLTQLSQSVTVVISLAD